MAPYSFIGALIHYSILAEELEVNNNLNAQKASKRKNSLSLLANLESERQPPSSN